MSNGNQGRKTICTGFLICGLGFLIWLVGFGLRLGIFYRGLVALDRASSLPFCHALRHGLWFRYIGRGNQGYLERRAAMKSCFESLALRLLPAAGRFPHEMIP
jgi:hypothetical protein